MFTRISMTVSCACIAGALSGVAGCSGEAIYPASGKVTFADGKPLAGGEVEFRSTVNPLMIARGFVGEDGAFRLSTRETGDGALVGEHEVAVHPPLLLTDRDLNPNPPHIIDEKFESYETSGLKFTVTEDDEKNKFEIVVTKPTKPDRPQRKVTVEPGLNVSR